MSRQTDRKTRKLMKLMNEQTDIYSQRNKNTKLIIRDGQTDRQPDGQTDNRGMDTITMYIKTNTDLPKTK